jgi:hypothetical protein
MAVLSARPRPCRRADGALAGLLGLRTLALVKHSAKQLDFDLHHLCWGLVANERIGSTESIPEIVYLLGLLADEVCGARVGFSLLKSFAEHLLRVRRWQTRPHKLNIDAD